MKNQEDEYYSHDDEGEETTEREIADALQWMVSAGLCEMSVNEDNEFVFWMTGEQKEMPEDYDE